MNAWLHQVGGLAAALAAADDTGLLQLLGQGAFSAEQIAARLELHPATTALVLDILVAQGIVVEREGRFEASDQLAAALTNELAVPGRFTGLWAQTGSLLRTGHCLTQSRSTTQREQVYSSAVPMLARLFQRDATTLADHLASTLEANESPEVLDMGAGSGVWSLSLLERLNRGRVTGLDLAEVLPRFREYASRLNKTDCIKTLAGDYHDTQLDAQAYDVVFLANILHLETRAGARSLIATAARALRPAGKLVIIDSLDDGSPKQRATSASYALHLALRIEHSRVHPRAEIDAWLQSEQLSPSERVPLQASGAGIAALIASR